MKLKEHYAKYKMMVGHQAIIASEKIPKHSFVGDDFSVTKALNFNSLKIIAITILV